MHENPTSRRLRDGPEATHAIDFFFCRFILDSFNGFDAEVLILSRNGGDCRSFEKRKKDRGKPVILAEVDDRVGIILFRRAVSLIVSRQC